jgi:DNA-binding IclR family transcriptional regulator
MVVRTADRTIQLFEAFADRGEPMTLSELARLLKIPTSTCFGLMRTLQARGYLYEVGGRRTFYPTSRWLVKARAIERNDPIQDQMQPYLDKLRNATGETVVLSKLLGEQVLYLSVTDGSHAVRYTANVGDLKPLNTTSSGKALLSAVPGPERILLLSRTRTASGTRLSAAQRAQLSQEIDAMAKRGWFVGRGENVIDVMGVAAPVYVGGDSLAVGIAGPMSRMEPKLQAHGKQLLATCKSLLRKT